MTQSHVFPRGASNDLPVAVGGEGCFLIDAAGKRYLDASGGAAVSCLGHGHPEVTAAVKAQLDEIAFAHTGFFTSKPAETLATLLADHAPGDLQRVYFVSGGSEAMEASIKLARQYFVERDEPSRDRIIARKQSYHGNTLGALGAGGNQWRRQPFAALLADTSHIDPCYSYRYQHEGESDEAYGLRAANELEREILAVGAERVMAFVAEPVVGATLGAVPPAPGYFKRIREICDRYGVLLILDEVMCGMGRTGSLFACEQDDVVPDIAAIAKGLGAGYQPLGAMMCTDAIYDTIRQGSGFFQHGHTYIGHPTACAAGVAVLQTLLEHRLVDRARDQGAKLQQRFREALDGHRFVGDVRGRGLFLGIELVADRAGKTPFDPWHKLHARIKAAAFAAGIVCYPMGGTIDGRSGDHILLAPPFIIEDDEMDFLVTTLTDVIDATTLEISAQS